MELENRYSSFLRVSFKTIVVLATVLFISPGLFQSLNAAENRWYFGVGAGADEIESDIVLWTILNPDHLDHDERDIGWKIFGGYSFCDFFSMELFYADFGKMTVSANSGAYIYSEDVVWEFTADNSEFETEIYAIGLGGVFYLPLHKFADKNYLKWVTPFVKFGIHYWDVQKKINPSDSVNYYGNPDPLNLGGLINHSVENDTGLDWYYGGGLSFNLNRHWSVLAAYEWYHITEAMLEDADFISVSAVFKF